MNIILVILLIVFGNRFSIGAEIKKQYCGNTENKIHCLINHFDELKENPAELENIYLKAEKQAERCIDFKIVSEFFEFSEKIKGMAAIEEYFAEAIEKNILIKNPECFIRTLLVTKRSAQNKICTMLGNPLFLQRKQIHIVFNNFRKEKDFYRLDVTCKSL